MLYTFTFHVLYNMDWIANTDFGLDPNNRVIKRLWCTLKEVKANLPIQLC